MAGGIIVHNNVAGGVTPDRNLGIEEVSGGGDGPIRPVEEVQGGGIEWRGGGGRRRRHGGGGGGGWRRN